jgi:hypothetical protein
MPLPRTVACEKRMGECGGVPIDINEDNEDEEVEARDGAPKEEVEGGATKESDDESEVR